MHTITSTAPRARRLAFLALLGTLLLLALAAPALAAQRPDYTGGPSRRTPTAGRLPALRPQ